MIHDRNTGTTVMTKTEKVKTFFEPLPPRPRPRPVPSAPRRSRGFAERNFGKGKKKLI